jgi:ribosome biogenesis protein ERB1
MARAKRGEEPAPDPAPPRRAARSAPAARAAPKEKAEKPAAAKAAARPAAARSRSAAAAAAAAPAASDSDDSDGEVPLAEAAAGLGSEEDDEASDGEVGGAGGARFGRAFRAALKAGGDHASDDEAAAEERGAGGPRRKARAGRAAAPSLPTAAAADGSDSSEDERAPRNTVGNVPMAWYKDEGHVGYDLTGQKLVKRAAAGERAGGGDAIDAFLARADSSRAWRTLYDEVNDETYTLSTEEVAMLRRLRSGQLPHTEVDPYAPYVDWADFDGDLGPGDVRHPFSSAPEPKRRFLPSKWEAKAVVKLVRALRRGWIKPTAEREADKAKAALPRLPYLLWDAGEDGGAAGPGDKTGSGLARIAPPKPALPGHEESYNPPLEYVPTEEEKAALLERAEYTGRPVFVPTAYGALRAVPAYAPLVRERFERCLDLYLCPRVAKQRLAIDPQSLLPQLPKPRELHPFPQAQCCSFRGHAGPLRALSAHPGGEWLATGGDDGDVRIWEIATARCCGVLHLGAKLQALAWCPAPGSAVLAAAAGDELVLLDTTPLLSGAPLDGRAAPAEALAGASGGGSDAHASWARGGPGGPGSVTLRLRMPARALAWHHQGDYLTSVAPAGGSAAVLVHQRSRCATQALFKRNRGRVAAAAFHPARPLLFVATQRHVYVYNLAKQALAKKLQAGGGPLTCLAVHPRGDNLLVGGADRRVAWFDLDLGATPYKTFASHAAGVAGVAFHPRLPLFASAADDAAAHVFHGRVYDDLASNALIVPLRVLRGHGAGDGVAPGADGGLTALAWHPAQPWLLTASMDGTARLWVNL